MPPSAKGKTPPPLPPKPLSWIGAGNDGDADDDLPPEWSVATTSTGAPLYVNLMTGKTTQIRPQRTAAHTGAAASSVHVNMGFTNPAMARRPGAGRGAGRGAGTGAGAGSTAAGAAAGAAAAAAAAAAGSAVAAVPLAAGTKWRQMVAPDTGATYWWNPDTEERSWEVPPEAVEGGSATAVGASTHGLVIAAGATSRQMELNRIANRDPYELIDKLKKPKRRAISYVLDVIRSHPEHPDLLAVACRTLKRELHQSSSAKRYASETEGIGLIISAMKAHVLHEELQAAGCVALRSLARSKQAVSALVAGGATDVAHRAQRRFPRNEEITSKHEQLLAVITHDDADPDKKCAVQ